MQQAGFCQRYLLFGCFWGILTLRVKERCEQTLDVMATDELSNAVELFNGFERTRGLVIRAIRETRVTDNLRPHELGQRAGLADPNVVYSLEDGKGPWNLNVIQSLMTALELPLDSVLPLPTMTTDQISYWRQAMVDVGAGEVARNDGLDLPRPEADPGLAPEDDVALGIFVRLKALQGMCDPRICEAT